MPSRQASFHSVASNHSRDKEEYDRFYGCDRNFIILTNAGKPIFSFHGDIYALSSVYATLYAMISKVQTFQLEKIDLKDKKSGNGQRITGSFG